MFHRGELTVAATSRGTCDITHEVAAIVRASSARIGLATVFLHRASASWIVCAEADPQLRRVGATKHRYELAPGLSAEQAAHLPDEVRAYATQIAGGGVGPYYGLLPLGEVAPIAAVRGVTAFTRALPIAHLVCGYAAVIPLDGDARDQVWIDARALGLVAPMYGSFTAYLIDWIDQVCRK